MSLVVDQELVLSCDGAPFSRRCISCPISYMTAKHLDQCASFKLERRCECAESRSRRRRRTCIRRVTTSVMRWLASSRAFALAEPSGLEGLTHENQRYIRAVRGVMLSPCCRVVEPNPSAPNSQNVCEIRVGRLRSLASPLASPARVRTGARAGRSQTLGRRSLFARSRSSCSRLQPADVHGPQLPRARRAARPTAATACARERRRLL